VSLNSDLSQVGSQDQTQVISTTNGQTTNVAANPETALSTFAQNQSQNTTQQSTTGTQSTLQAIGTNSLAVLNIVLTSLKIALLSLIHFLTGA
jgi:hypothetical protein